MTGVTVLNRLLQRLAIQFAVNFQRYAFIIGRRDLGRDNLRREYLALRFQRRDMQRLKRGGHVAGNPVFAIRQAEARRCGRDLRRVRVIVLAPAQQTIGAHFQRTVLDGVDDVVDILIIMGGSHIRGEPL